MYYDNSESTAAYTTLTSLSPCTPSFVSTQSSLLDNEITHLECLLNLSASDTVQDCLKVTYKVFAPQHF